MKAGFVRPKAQSQNSKKERGEKTVLEKMYASELSLVAFFPLLFSLFYFMPLLVEPFVWHEYLIIFLAYLCFIGLYCLCRVHESRAFVYIVLIVAISLAVGAINWMSYAFLWYCAYLCGYLYTALKAVISNIALVFCITVIWSFTEQPFFFFIAIATLPSFGLMLYGMFDRRVRREEADKRERNKQIEALATIAERERLARDIHDVIGHNLTALCLKSRLAQKLGKAGDMDAALKEIEEVEQLASHALQDVRSAISQYKKRSFAEQLNALSQKLEDAGFRVSCQIEAEAIAAKKESHFILILTEAVTNILRHSNGDRVSIRLEENAEGFVLQVEDNGTDYSSVAVGNGINGIRERAADMQGRLDIFCDKGFVLQVTV